MRSKPNVPITPLITSPKTKSKSRHYPSKVLSQLMNSDSEDDYLQQIHDVKLVEKNKSNRRQELPLLINRKQGTKQNMSYDANKLAQEIKYSCYKVYEGKLVELPSSCQYHSLNLQQTSIIPENNEGQLTQKIPQQVLQQQKYLNSRIGELQQKNKTLQREVNLLLDKLKTKQIYYQNEIEHRNKKIQDMETQISNRKEQNIKKQKQKKQNELSRYLSRNGKQNIKQQVQYHRIEEIIENVYKQIKVYLVKRIQQFKDKICVQKMNQVVQEIIQEFMTEIININSITVSRCVKRNKKNCSPALINQILRIAPEDDVSLLSKSCLFKQSCYTQQTQIPAKTPPKSSKKPESQKQKPEQLRQLQKSLKKLRQMQKQSVNRRISNINKQVVQSLDRSSFLGLDRSRSKSRRKKIFQ